MLEKEEIQEKLEKGWIRSSMWFEVMTADRQVAEDTLKEHVKALQKLKNTHILKESLEETVEVTPPPKNVEKAFSKIAQVEILTKDMETLLFTVIYFAPSGVEVLEPKELSIGAETVQAMMNSVADVMHKLAAGGAGGIVVSTRK